MGGGINIDSITANCVNFITDTLNRVKFSSACSFYDDEEICKHNKYLGTRAERGLFITKDGRKINADINGALNILKKSKTEDGSVISRLMNSGVTTPMRRLVL